MDDHVLRTSEHHMLCTRSCQRHFVYHFLYKGQFNGMQLQRTIQLYKASIYLAFSGKQIDERIIGYLFLEFSLFDDDSHRLRKKIIPGKTRHQYPMVNNKDCSISKHLHILKLMNESFLLQAPHILFDQICHRHRTINRISSSIKMY